MIEGKLQFWFPFNRLNHIIYSLILYFKSVGFLYN